MRFAGCIISGILITGMLFAQQDSRPGPGDRAFSLQGLKNYLNLSDDQVSNLKTVETEMRDALKPLARDLGAKTQALREENQKPAPDAGVIAQLRGEISGLRDQIRTERSDFQGRLRAILNAAQLESLARLEEALRLFPIARAAAGINLINAQQGAESGRFGQSGAFGPGRMMR